MSVVIRINAQQTRRLGCRLAFLYLMGCMARWKGQITSITARLRLNTLTVLVLCVFQEYVIPKGFLFEYVTCPNYSAEIAGWVLFTIATQTAAAGIFTLVGAGQMLQWAMGKHARLRRTFHGKDGKEKYQVRYVLVPGMI